MEGKKIMKKKKLILIIALILATAISGILIGRLSVGSVSAEGEGYETLRYLQRCFLLSKETMLKT